jgi:O-antigen/teichoic acid export membrane protein
LAFATTLTGYLTAVELGIATSVTKHVGDCRADGKHERINSMMNGSLLLMIGIGAVIAISLVVLAPVGGRALFGSPRSADRWWRPSWWLQ